MTVCRITLISWVFCKRLTEKNISDMTYTVSSGTLNPTQVDHGQFLARDSMYA